jgi:hypothetical protein
MLVFIQLAFRCQADVCSAASTPTKRETMGLIEKRLIKRGQEEWVPEANKELQEVTKGPQVYEVAWATFESDADALNNLQNQGLRRITAAFRVVCGDDLGKEAVQESVKKVIVTNIATSAEKSILVKDGAATIAGAWGKGGDGFFTDREIQLALEKQL